MIIPDMIMKLSGCDNKFWKNFWELMKTIIHFKAEQVGCYIFFYDVKKNSINVYTYLHYIFCMYQSCPPHRQETHPSVVSCMAFGCISREGYIRWLNPLKWGIMSTRESDWPRCVVSQWWAKGWAMLMRMTSVGTMHRLCGKGLIIG